MTQVNGWDMIPLPWHIDYDSCCFCFEGGRVYELVHSSINGSYPIIRKKAINRRYFCRICSKLSFEIKNLAGTIDKIINMVVLTPIYINK